MPTNAIALTRLFLTERPSLMRLVQRIVGSAETAEDVTQNLWLQVQRVNDDLPIANQRAYLYRLTANLATDHVRADSSRTTIQAKAQTYLWDELDRPSPEQEVIARDELARVLRAAEELPEPTKGIFRLHRFKGMAQAEVAAHYGVSTTTVEKHIRRAMAALRKARDAE